jgi:hypothetical protein
LTIPEVQALSVWSGMADCGWPILARAIQRGAASFAL